MNHKPDLPEKLGRSLNELDIDFSSFTPVGWAISLIALMMGGAVAGFAGWLLSRRNGINAAAGMTFCFTLLIVTTITFLGLRRMVTSCGLSITRPKK
jgi:hypothetical protein